MTKKVFGLTIFIATAFTATAQLADTLGKALLDEVIVTANKFPQKQSTTGKVISVISKEQIERSSGRTVPQLLNEQAGITINGALSNLGSNQTLYMRGASSGRALVLIDGMPVSDPTFINNDFDLNLLSLNSIERIEISRGAQSTLYGSDAVAGVVNIITVKKDITKPINVKAALAAGNLGTYRGNIQLYGKANKLTYNTSYAKLRSGGFSAAFDSSGNKGFDNDGYNSDVARASLQYQLNDNFSVRTFAQYSRYKTDLDASLFKDEKDYTSTNSILTTGASFNYHRDNVNLTGNYQYSENKRNYYNDSLDKPSFTSFSNDNYFGKSQFIELYSNIQISKNISLLNGADYRYNSMNSSYKSLSALGPYNTSFRDTLHSQSSLYTSIFVHDSQQKLNIELGGRLNVHSRYGSNHTFTFNPSYNFTNHFRTFGSIATGFKAPTLYQLYSSYGNLNLKPERSTTFELGVQQTHDKVATRIVYFNREIKEGIDFNNISNKYFNYIRQKVNGVELETKVEPVTNFTLSANYTYIKPKEESQSRVNFKDTTYSYLLRRPQHNANITAGYKFNNGLYISATGKYVAKRYDAGGYKVPDVLLDSYFILSAYAEYFFSQHAKVFMDGQNLTNKKFFDVRGYNSIPFLFNAGVVLNW
jgi:vitamin B12 transporter